MRQSYRLIWNSVAIWALRVIQLIPQVLLLPFLIHRIGEDLYGIFVLAWSIIPVFELLQAGLASGVVKYSAGFFEKKQTGEINRILSTSCLMTGLLGLLGGLLILSITYFIPGLLRMVSAENPEQLKLACNSIALMIMTSFPLMPYSGILHSLQRYDIFSLVRVTVDYLRVGFIVGWFWMLGPSFEVLVIASVVSFFLSNVCLTLIAYRMMPGLKNDFKLCNFKTVKLLMGFGGVILLRNFCVVLNYSGVMWLVGILVSPAFVAVLAVILKPVQLIKQIIQAMSVSVMPASSKYSATNNTKMLQELYVRGTRYMAAMLTVGVMMVLVLAQPVMRLWMGQDFEYLYSYVIVICLGMSVWMSTESAGRMFEGMGMLKERLISSLVGPVLVTIPLIVLLLLVFDLGHWAVIWGLIAGYMVEAAMRIIYFSKETNLNLQIFFWHAYGQGLAIGAPLIGLQIGFIYYFQLHSLPARTAVAAVSVLLYSTLFAVLFATAAEKNMLSDILNHLWKRLLRVRSQSLKLM